MEKHDSPVIELSVVMPCLNEADTLSICIDKARAAFAQCGCVGEVIVADNGSDDGCPEIAEAHGARLGQRGSPRCLFAVCQHVRSQQNRARQKR